MCYDPVLKSNVLKYIINVLLSMLSKFTFKVTTVLKRIMNSTHLFDLSFIIEVWDSSAYIISKFDLKHAFSIFIRSSFINIYK